jgi:aminopeptidase-like protein
VTVLVSGATSASPEEAQLNDVAEQVGREAHELVARLFPFCRSLTGDGVRRTLEAICDVIPLQIHEVPTGTRAYDWEVPDEWNVRDAYVLDSSGHRVVDFRAHTLHVVGYSAPIDRRVSREELFAHLFTDAEHPDWIPYRHLYYRDGWGFCTRHRDLVRFDESEYRVVIDSTLQAGNLTYGELVVPGHESGTFLISTHTCHPSLCNDNLSGIATTALLAREWMKRTRRFGARFIFAPATLGPLVWLSRNEPVLAQIRAGFVVANVGDAGAPTYYRSRRDTAAVDRAVAHVFHHAARGTASIRPFAPVGYDQRQYCSPGFNLPIGCLQRTPNGEYPQYHSSGDDLNFVTPAALGDSWRLLYLALQLLDEDARFVNLYPNGEPRLGPRGLHGVAESLGLFWILNLSDGQHSLLDIAERSGLSFWRLLEGARRLEAAGLVQRVSDERTIKPRSGAERDGQ